MLSWIIIEPCDHSGHILILTIPTPIFFSQLLISMNLYQHAKNQATSSFCSINVVDLKILQSDWPRALWPISLGPDFSQIWNLRRNGAHNINFNYRPNSEKTNDHIFHWIQKILFFSPFPPFFWVIVFYQKNLALSRITSDGFLTLSWNLTQTNSNSNKMSEKMDGRMDGWMDPILLDILGYCQVSSNHL